MKKNNFKNIQLQQNVKDWIKHVINIRINK